MSHPESLTEKKEKSFKVLRIGLDADDTCFDVRQPSLNILNATYGTSFTKEDINTFWYMQTFLKQIGVLKEEQKLSLMRFIVRQMTLTEFIEILCPFLERWG